MNAITPAQTLESAPSNLAILQRLVELGAQLAERAAHEAFGDDSTKPDQPKAQSPRRPDPHLTYIRLWRTIKENIDLQTRLAAGLLPKEPRPRREPAPPQTPQPEPAAQVEPAAQAENPNEDPRRPHILRYFRESIDITRKRRKIPITHQQIEEHVDAELAKDPNRCRPGHFLLLKICKSVDLPFYANRMPLDLLRPPRPITQPLA